MVHDSLIICKSSETVQKERDGSNRQLAINSEKLWYPKLPFVRGHLLQGIRVVLMVWLQRFKRRGLAQCFNRTSYKIPEASGLSETC